MRAAVITISDRCSRGQATDVSGPQVRDALIRTLEAEVGPVVVIPDDRDAIVSALRACVADGVELVTTTGGTGCGPRDITPEATRQVIEREVPGLAEAMRADSARVTPHAALSRGVCGIAGRTLIINLPGSPRGAVENLLAVVRVIPHALRLIGGDTSHPAETGPPETDRRT